MKNKANHQNDKQTSLSTLFEKKKKHHANIPDSKVVNKTLYSFFLNEDILNLISL